MNGYLKHVALATSIGFVSAVFMCLSKAHHLDVGCIYDALGAVATSLVSYMIALQRSAPGMVQLPADFAGAIKSTRQMDQFKDPDRL